MAHPPGTPSIQPPGVPTRGASAKSVPIPAPRLRPPEKAPGDLREGLSAVQVPSAPTLPGTPGIQPPGVPSAVSCQHPPLPFVRLLSFRFAALCGWARDFVACYLFATPHNALLCNRAEKPASYIIGVMRHVFLSFRLHNISRSICKSRCKQTACQKNTLTILQATFLKDAPPTIPPTPEGELTNNLRMFVPRSAVGVARLQPGQKTALFSAAGFVRPLRSTNRRNSDKLPKQHHRWPGSASVWI